MNSVRLPTRLTAAVYLVITALFWAAATAVGCSSTDSGSAAPDASADSSTTVEAGPPDSTATCSGGQTQCSGSCVNTKSDPHNCGSCGATCGGGLVCSNGQCAVGCTGTQTLCGAGTCADLNSDFDNCGKCGNACQAGQVCSSGQCSLFCNAPNKTCGGSCINTSTDPANCGDCGKQCATGQVCAGGTCAFSCGQLTTCTTDAGAFCTNTQTDNTNCGKCGTACGPGQVCAGGQCTVSCQPGQVDCSGKCIDPTSDNQHCGATGACGAGGSGSAGTACGSGQTCAGGVCSISCPPGEVACNGLCIDPLSSNQYCGATAGCGVADAGTAGTTCPSGKVCSAGTCSSSCATGLVLCTANGVPTCVNPKTDSNFCGATGNCQGSNAGQACGPGTVCASGSCQTSCQPGTIICNGKCVDPSTDPNYCGAGGNCQGINAGVVCPSGHICQLGTCQLTCASNQADCNNTCIDPLTNTQHCGASIPDCTNPGVACSAGQLCVNGACQLSCQSGLTPCGTPLTCVNGQTDNTYCGAYLDGGVCSGYSACGPEQACQSGKCTFTCPSGQIVCQGSCIDPSSNNTFCGATGDCKGADAGGTGSSGTKCPPGENCQSSSCTISCPAPEVPCSGVCVNESTDNNNCGSCGTVCAAGQSCQGGAGDAGCQILCPPNEINCGGTCVDPTTDSNNCGTCASIDGGAVCPPGKVCSHGACTTTCGSGLNNCNNKCSDPQTDPKNCGGCGNKCNSGICTAGSCAAETTQIGTSGIINYAGQCGGGSEAQSKSSGLAGQYGFIWTDVSTPTAGTVRPTSVQISFTQDLQCGPTTALAMTLNGHPLTATFTPPSASSACNACGTPPGAGNSITLNLASDLQNYNLNGTNTLVIQAPYTDPDAGALPVVQGYLPVTGSEYANIVITFP